MPDPAYILEGERAALGPPRREYAEVLAAWFNEPEVRRGLAHRGLQSVEAEAGWLSEQMAESAKPRPANVLFVIHDAQDDAVVGVAGLEQIDWGFGRANFGIYVGPRRGEGIGTEATRLVLDWAFVLMGLHNVCLETYDWNEQARRAYLKAGFRDIGRRRGAAVTLGRRCDVILMDATADDFDSPVLGKLRS